jgi:putative serine/threonine protein kinase
MWKELVDLESIRKLLTYPYDVKDISDFRVERLRSLGVRGVYNYGSVVVNGFKVLGKGHASIVLLVNHESLGDVVVKIRRLDSKRKSLTNEGYIMSLVKYDVVPKVYYYDDDFIMMEYLDGTLLGDYIRLHSTEEVIKVFLKVFEASHKLDLSSVDHLELSKPHKHVMVLRDGNVKFLDFESARISETPCNLCRVYSAYIHLIKRKDLTHVRGLLKTYKLGRKDLFKDIVDLILKV